ncbi:hypothetical protein NDU88_004691 [Pleurodeles waltl]|uniref:Uncharacterized protein n=1 Tax=Pleurodeles waltl TaxID=8319 RepID=A0AAV7LJ23_PLEWA|nr:hypothetical protein NDU88_004691 [Pleurodeles waltl]
MIGQCSRTTEGERQPDNPFGLAEAFEQKTEGAPLGLRHPPLWLTWLQSLRVIMEELWSIGEASLQVGLQPQWCEVVQLIRPRSVAYNSEGDPERW